MLWISFSGGVGVDWSVGYKVGGVCYGRRVDGAQEGGGVSGDLPSTTIKLVSLRLTKHCALGQGFRVQVRRLYYGFRNLVRLTVPANWIRAAYSSCPREGDEGKR